MAFPIKVRAGVALMLVVLLTIPSQWGTFGFDHEEEKDSLLVEFNGRTQLVFGATELRTFYKCLCSSNIKACSFHYEIVEGGSYFSVSNVGDRVHPKSSLANNNTFVCERPGMEKDSGLLICDRTNVSACDNVGSMSKWKFVDVSCNFKCINLCWFNSNVSFSRADSGSVPEKGQCESLEPTSDNEGNLSNTDGDDQQNPSDKTSIHKFILIGLGSAVLVVAVAAIFLVFYRRRKSSSNQGIGARQPSYTDIQPCASTIVGDDGNANDTKDLTSFPNGATCVSSQDSGMSEIYAYARNVYCTVEGEEELESSKSITKAAKEYPNPNQPRLEHMFNTQVSADEHQKEEAYHVYAELYDGKKNTPQNAITTYNTESTGEHTEEQQRTGTEGVYASNPYSRLTSRTEISEDIKKHLQETYDVPAGKFVAAPHKQRTLEDLPLGAQSRVFDALNTDNEIVVKESQHNTCATSTNSIQDHGARRSTRDQEEINKTNEITAGGYDTTLPGIQSCSEHNQLKVEYFNLEEMAGIFAGESGDCLDIKLLSSERGALTGHQIEENDNLVPDDNKTRAAHHYESVANLDKDNEKDDKRNDTQVQMSGLSNENIYQEIADR